MRGGLWAAFWGVGGVVALLAHATVRLATQAAGLLHVSLAPVEAAGLAASFLFFGCVEGYAGFQRAFAPRVVVRALWLASHPRPHLVLLAPLFCMGLLHATRRRLIVSWTLLAGIVAVVLLMDRVPQPWRGIVDAGVAFALAWGVLAILAFFGLALAARPPAISADVPAG